MTSQWQDAFRRYELIAGVWPVDAGSRKLLRDAVFASVPMAPFLERLKPQAHAPFTRKACRQIDALQPLFANAWRRGNVRPDLEIFEDVYHAAIYLLWSDWTGMHWFRGQRRQQWPTTPAIYRDEASDDKIAAAVANVASFCEYLERQYPAPLSEVQCVAVAQHYHVPTWLLDATRSPWIALYFASLDGEENDVGVVRQIDPHYWRGLDTGVVEISVPGVRRIEKQEGVFLVAPHPDLFDQYVGLELRFRQRSGLAFESHVFQTGADLLRAHDPITAVVDAWRQEQPASVRGLSEPPPLTSFSPLTGEDYFNLAVSRHAARRDLSAAEEAALRLIGRLHAEVQARKEQVSPTERSLNHLARAVSSVLAASHPLVAGSNPRRRWDELIAHYQKSFPFGYVADLVDTASAPFGAPGPQPGA